MNPSQNTHTYSSSDHNMLSGDQILVATISTTTPHEETLNHEEHHSIRFRDIHALSPPPRYPSPPPPATNRHRLRQPWETRSRTPSVLSTVSTDGGGGWTENIYSTMSREFNALVVAGSTIGNNGSEVDHTGSVMGRIGEEEADEETNRLAIVPDNSPVDPWESPRRRDGGRRLTNGGGEGSVERVKKEEVEMKIIAWQNGKIAKINNRFKREDSIISGWKNEQVQKSTSWMKKVERKLEEKRARAIEKMENEIAKAERKAEERRATAEGRRGRKVAKVLEIAHLMKAVGRPPPKRSYF